MPRRLIYIFPGQASQYVGMGKALYDSSPVAAGVMDKAAGIAGLSHLPDVCFSGPEDLLTRTDNVQPAITAVSLMSLAALNEGFGKAGLDVKPAVCMGHSLGEYAAHYAAGNLSLDLTLELVQARGRWMNEASQPPNPPGAMLAVMGMPLEKVEQIAERHFYNRIAVANLNSPGQVIVSGEVSAIAEAESEFPSFGAKRCVRLKVSGAWHSPLMRPAQEKMAKLLKARLTLDTCSVNPRIPVIANSTSDAVKDTAMLRATLTTQITSPVRWQDCVARSLQIAGGMEPPLFVEIGPGTVLKGLLRSIDRSLEVVNVEIPEGVRELVDTLRAG